VEEMLSSKWLKNPKYAVIMQPLITFPLLSGAYSEVLAPHFLDVLWALGTCHRVPAGIIARVPLSVIIPAGIITRG
jgi:hypothetical protein